MMITRRVSKAKNFNLKRDEGESEEEENYKDFGKKNYETLEVKVSGRQLRERKNKMNETTAE